MDNLGRSLRILPDRPTTPHRRRENGNGSEMAEDLQRNMTEMMRLLQASIEAQTAALQAQAEASREAGERRQAAPKLEKPATFSGVKGKDESDLNTFIGQCENQFRVDPRAFETDGAKVGFAISLLRGRAGEVVVSLSADEARKDVIGSWEKFKEYLDSTFGDPDRKNAARRALQNLQQLGSAAAYFVEVERLAGILGWTTRETQAVLVGQVERGLKAGLQVEIARHGRVFETVRELSDFIVPLDERLYSIQVEESLRGRRVREGQIGDGPAGGRAEIRMGGFARPSLPVKAVSFPGPVRPPMGLPIRYIDGVWRTLTFGEFSHRKENNLCYVCGASNHRSFECDKVPPAVAVKGEGKE